MVDLESVAVALSVRLAEVPLPANTELPAAPAVPFRLLIVPTRPDRLPLPELLIVRVAVTVLPTSTLPTLPELRLAPEIVVPLFATSTLATGATPLPLIVAVRVPAAFVLPPPLTKVPTMVAVAVPVWVGVKM